MTSLTYTNSIQEIEQTTKYAEILAQDLVDNYIEENNLSFVDILDSLAMLGLTIVKDTKMLSSESYIRAIAPK